MACIGFLLGCKHVHSAKGYILMVLMIVGIILGTRVVLFIVIRCLERRQSAGASGVNEGIEMRLQSMNQQNRSSMRRANAECKVVIVAGNDHVSFIAQPCPFKANPNG